MSRKISSLLILAVVLFPLLCFAENDSAGDSADLLQNQTAPNSKAIQLFLIHRYEEALSEFRTAVASDPSDIVARRYVGACLSALRRDEEAFITFNEVLRMSPKDLSVLKLLANTHLRRGETSKSRAYLEKLVEYDVDGGRFSVYAKGQLEKLQMISSTGTLGAEPLSGQMGAEEFMKTQGVIRFMDAEFEKSVEAFDVLEVQYPKDVMVKRYKGIALDKLGRYEEAVNTFNEGLAISPENAALRYALAQTLFHKKDMEASRATLTYLAMSGVSSDYKIRADRDLEAIDRIESIRLASEGKKWSFVIEQGAEFNSNAASEPKKEQVPAEEHAVRFPGSLYGSYELRKDGPWTLTGSYSYAHSFYSDTLDYLNTLVHVPTATVSYLGKLWDRPYVAMFSSSYVHVSVDEQMYYQSYPQTFRWVYSWVDWHRLTLSESVAYTDYQDQGLTPDSTSREGVSNAAKATNTFYLNDTKDLNLAVGFEFKVEDTQGSNYVRNIHQISTDFGFPVWRDWTGLLGFRYKNSDYPETVLPIARQDDEYLVNTRLTVPMNKNTNLKVFLDYLNNNSNDPSYNYVNLSGGASIVASF